MPDLAPYAAEVLSAYTVSLALLAGLAAWYWARGRRVRAELDQVEHRQDAPR